MKTFWFSFVALVVIHTLDMIFTERRVGDSWGSETFLPMSMTIKFVGIYTALWASRLCMYTYFWFTMYFRKNRAMRTTLYVITILYWTAMMSWLYTFGWVNWP